MTSDDAEEYNETIIDIYEKQNNPSKMIEKRTHIIKSEVNNIHWDLNKKTSQTNTYFELKIEHLDAVLKQFIKTSE